MNAQSPYVPRKIDLVSEVVHGPRQAFCRLAWCAKIARALPVFPTYKNDRVCERVEKTLQKKGVNFFFSVIL